MSTTVALIGAGGKMGARVGRNLRRDAAWRTLSCEKSPAAIAKLQAEGVTVVPAEAAVAEADYTILAVPDRLIGTVSRGLAPHLKRGSTLVLLDPAAAVADEVEVPPGVNAVVCHPCHPPLFGEQPTPEARRDFFGGVAAWQDIVMARLRGPAETLAAAEPLCRTMFQPVRQAHHITVEQMAILEPTMAEVVAAAAAVLMKEALEEAVKAGVPRAAAESFMLGHAQIPLAIVFGAIPSPFSDAAQIAVRWGTERILRPDWRQVFEPAAVREAVHAMLHGEERPA